MRDSLGDFEMLLLLAVIRLGPGAHGGSVREDIERRTGRVASPGAVYTAFDRLERRGLVASWLGDPTPQRGGKRKRHYRIEPAGVEMLRRTRQAIDAMSRGLAPKLGSL